MTTPYDGYDVGVSDSTNGTVSQNGTGNSHTTHAYNHESSDFDHKVFIYPVFAFEPPIYLVLWECLVIWTLLFNLIVVMILLRRKLRNSSNIILVFIAVSDSLTGLVTLPTYMYVYRQSGPGQNPVASGGENFYVYTDDYPHVDGGNSSDVPFYTDPYTDESGEMTSHGDNFDVYTDDYPHVAGGNSSDVPFYTDPYTDESGEMTSHGDNFDVYTDDYPHVAGGNSSDVPFYTDPYTDESGEMTSQADYYSLTKGWCQVFMISKFFVSKAFHTISIWLTLFLGVQRYVSVRFPFKSQQLFTIRNTLLFVLLIYLISPWIHVYHLLDEKARDSTGLCEWSLERDCAGGCAYLWLAFLVHFIPCVLLVIFTILMIIRLYKAAAAARDSMPRERAVERNGANRRITLIVSTIVIVFLIPEIPYGFFLLYSVLRRHAGLDIMITENNRAFHAAYDLLLVTTFHANFWIYTGLNRRFRFELRNIFAFALGPMYRTIGASFRRSFHSGIFSRSSMRTSRRTTNTDASTHAVAIEMTPLRDGPQTQPHDHGTAVAEIAPLQDAASST